MSNNEEIFGGLNNLLKNIDLTQLTSLVSGLNNKSPEEGEGSPAPKVDITQLNSLLSNIDLNKIGNLLSGFKLGQSNDEEEDEEGEEGAEKSMLSNFNLDALRNINLDGLNLDNLNESGLFNIEELKSALGEFTEKLQGFRKL